MLPQELRAAELELTPLGLSVFDPQPSPWSVAVNSLVFLCFMVFICFWVFLLLLT